MGDADIYLHKADVKCWDICAPEVLAKAMGGYGTTRNGEIPTYIKDKKVKGILLAQNKNKHSCIFERLKAAE